MHDPRIGRFFAVDPLFREYPNYAPYSFSGNRVIDAYELEGLEPQNYLAVGGKLTGTVSYFLNAAFGVRTSTSNATTLQREQEAEHGLIGAIYHWTFAHKEKTDAMTLFNRVIFKTSFWRGDKSDKDWLAIIAHEMIHREDIESKGGLRFYVDYGREHNLGKDYESNKYEIKAYAVGGRSFSEMNKFNKLDIADGFYEMLQSNNLSETQKKNHVDYYVNKYFKLPRIEEKLNMYQNMVDNYKEQMSNWTPGSATPIPTLSPGVYKQIENLTNEKKSLESKIKKSVDSGYGEYKKED